ncbi:hypothetical protein [Cronobacter phage EspYZU12]|nr:hypothetical protein EspYZU15_162 [Cronobacter phage EspYZU15]WAK45568.1 hypothetical protein EspYZU14_164 [Cronobacter phage EspYZU14]WBF78352.1 hypothetical protein [Cronobacter phage EspYZU12]
MQSRHYEDLLREIHKDSIDQWFHSEEEYQQHKEKEMGGDTILDFIKREVWQDSDTGKWRFKNKEFKREGQAEKAAVQYFKKKNS